MVVYGFNSLTPLDLIAFPREDVINLDGRKKPESMKDLHLKVQRQLEKANEAFARQAHQ